MRELHNDLMLPVTQGGFYIAHKLRKSLYRLHSTLQIYAQIQKSYDQQK